MAVRKPKEKPYREIGSIEGTMYGVERDGYGRPLLWVKLRLSGETIKCIARGSAQTEVEHHEIADIWKTGASGFLVPFTTKRSGRSRRSSPMRCSSYGPKMNCRVRARSSMKTSPAA